MNPEARRVTPALQRVVIAALEARFKLECTETSSRDAGISVARQAVEEGSEHVFAFGGDGLVNEVVNGIVGSQVTLGVIPGGTMNVFARNLGISSDPVEATDRIISATDEKASRSVALARANDRYFTFSCGCGFDAEAAAFVESHKRAKRRYGESFFYGAALLTLLRGYSERVPFLDVQFGRRREIAVMAIALNRGPYAYFMGREVNLVRKSDRGINLFVLRKMGLLSVPIYGLGAIGTGHFGSHAVKANDLERVEISSSLAFALHVDGEPLEKTSHVEIVREASEVRVIV